MASLLNLPTKYYQTFAVNLDGVAYLISYQYNQRVGSWFIDIATSDGTKILEGKKLNQEVSLLKHHKGDSSFPPGLLALICTSSVPKEPTFENLSQDFIMVYVPESEI